METKIQKAYRLATQLMNEYDNWNTAVAEAKIEYNLSNREVRLVNEMAEED